MPQEPPSASSSGLPQLPEFSPAESSLWVTSFRGHFREWVFSPIDRLVPSRDALISFIFMACAIDYLAGFWWGGSTEREGKKAYVGFIREYFPQGRYDPEGLYDSLRNGLVHMFTIKGRKYALTHNNPQPHLEVDKRDQIILNAGDFARDLHEAAEKYFDAAAANTDLAAKAYERFNRDGFLGASPLEMP